MLGEDTVLIKPDIDEAIDDFRTALKDLKHIMDYLGDGSTYSAGLPKENILAIYDLKISEKMLKRKLKNLEKKKNFVVNNDNR